MRRAARVLGLAAVAVMAAACSESASSPAPAAPQPVITAPVFTTVFQSPTFPTVQLEAFDIQAVRTGAEQFEGAGPQVTGLLERYLNNAMLVPLRTGKPVGDVSPMFSSEAAARLDGRDRGALFDEGLPKASDVVVTAATAKVSMLVDPRGDLGVAVAQFHIGLTASVADTPLVVDRTGEFLLGPEGSMWKIIGYRVRVTRETPNQTTVTTAA